MKPVTLQQTNVAQEQLSPLGSSLSSNFAPLNLENKFLARTSTLSPQSCSDLLMFTTQSSSHSSLQPSSLSSTSSSLLCTSSYLSSFTSPLLSTENTLLSSLSVPRTSSCLTSVANGYLVSTGLPSSASLHQSAHDEDEEENSQVNQSCLGETSPVNKTL